MRVRSTILLAALFSAGMCFGAQTAPGRTSGGAQTTPKASSNAAGTSQQTSDTDNTRINQRDRNSAEPTADSQSGSQADRDLSAAIRKSIMDDKSLSTYAHNIKVISQNGMVTLKGPVRTDAEKKAVEEKARTVAGNSKIKSEITVEPEQSR